MLDLPIANPPDSLKLQQLKISSINLIQKGTPISYHGDNIYLYKNYGYINVLLFSLSCECNIIWLFAVCMYIDIPTSDSKEKKLKKTSTGEGVDGQSLVRMEFV